VARRAYARLPLLATILLVAAAGLARGEITQDDGLRAVVSGSLRPQALPRHGVAPISVEIEGHVATTDGSAPPQLNRLDIRLNRHGRIESRGLAVCRFDEVQPASISRALSNCRDALVGGGRFWASIVLPGQDPHPTVGRVVVFNGRRHGEPVLLGHIYARRPFTTSFTIVFSIRRHSSGDFGTRLSATIPRTTARWLHMTGIRLTLSRTYLDDGRRRSYLSAGCPAPAGFPGAVFQLAQADFRFEDGRSLGAPVMDRCEVSGG
jgi:hypothetical protein